MSYQYIGEEGDFCVKNPEKTSYLYFPLANENGVKSCVTPDLGGDLKTGQNSFFMAPVSSENLHNDKSTRNFWCILEEKDAWSLTGRSGAQQSRLFSREKEETVLEAGMMYHKLTRISKEHELRAEITNFVPFTGEQAEVIKVTVENAGTKKRHIKLISAIPIYGRSADNIRDHRHVTALLHRIQVREFGVAVNPTMAFNERGHEVNHLIYGVFGGFGEEKPVGFFPVLEDFIGEGGNLENPEAVFCRKSGVKAGYQTAGYEALGGLEFAEKEVLPGEKMTCMFVMAFGENIEEMEKTARKFLEESYFDHSLEKTAACWQEKVNIKYHTGDKDFDCWMRWVSFQPMLRRIYGCSFLPHHDYGRGGRGWRDLWQDCLALLLMNPDGVRKMIVDNICGVRLDGTNATIIGSRQGEFLADRNHIVNQNRRCDVLFAPWVGDYNIKLFFDLIQTDGCNPLVIRPVTYHVKNREAILDGVCPPSRDIVKHFLKRSFSPGELFHFLEENHVGLTCDKKDFLDLIADNGIQEFHADFSEGYWTDHWTYNLDLIETYLEIFPDREEELLFLDKGYTFYESQAVVLPRKERYMVSKDGVRQNAFLKEVCRHSGQKGKLRTKTGEVYQTTLAVKLFTVAVNKFAALDTQGLGIEMEAGKPGWYDALNGMPGIFGSSMCESYELFRLIRFLLKEIKCYKRPVVMPEELDGFMKDITQALFCYYEEGCSKEWLWDEMNLAKEAYRKKTEGEISGREIERDGDVLAVFLETCGRYLAEGIFPETGNDRGIPLSYFYYHFTDLRMEEGKMYLENGKRFSMPLFLEGAVHYMNWIYMLKKGYLESF